MSRKKILWLCSWYPGKLEPFNGDFIQRHAQAAALYNDIYVIHAYGDATGKMRKTINEIVEHEHLTEHLVYYPKSGKGFGKMIGGYRWLTLMRRSIRDYVRKFGKPDAVHIHIPMKAGIFGIWMKRRYGLPYVLTEHWGIYNDVAVDHFNKRGKSFRKYTREIFAQAAVFTTVSRFLAEGVNRLVIPKEWIVTPNVVNTELFHFTENNEQNKFRFIHVSNMIPLKNAEGILRAFRALLDIRRDTELTMVGDKDPSIRLLANELGLDDYVRFTGEITYDEVAAEMKNSHCLVLFSNMENSPCVIGESLCCGLPVIATAVGGIPELVTNENGLLIEAGDEAALKNAMASVISGYGNYDRLDISKKAVSKFSYPIVGKQFDAIYEKIKGTTP